VRVVFSGTVVSNGGDAAIMEAQHFVLERALGKIEGVLVDTAPDVARSLFPQFERAEPLLPVRFRGRGRAIGRALRRMHRRRLLWLGRTTAAGGALGPLLPWERRALARFGEADLIGYTGGTSLIEKYDLDPKFLELEFAIALGVPLVLLPQSLGPFIDPVNQQRLRPIIAQAARTFVRDKRSYQNLVDIDADVSRVDVVPDIVFALTQADAAHRIRQSSLPETDLSVLISARDVTAFCSDGSKGQIRYEASMVRLVRHLVKDLGGRITFLSTCQGIEGYSHDDSAVAARIFGQLEPDLSEHVTVDRGLHTPAEFRSLLASFDLAVATRMHAGIQALNVGVPVLPIAYEFKTHEVMTDLGLGDFVVDIEDIDPDTLGTAVDRLIASLPSIRDDVARKLVEARDGAIAVGATTERVLRAR
jgi:colanic acid/amylovoran biosynthesis protein